MKYKIIMFTLILITCFSFVFANDNLHISSKAAVVMDADSSIVLYSKEMDKKIYPASTTKILTAILALENLDITQAIVVSKSAIQIPWDSSSVYLKEGEILTVEDLLYCTLLNSGNDAANVLAEAVSGDISKFVTSMNLKASEIGCTNTHFNNAHGYSDDNHYTTALDMAKIFNYCIQNDKFLEIISTKSYTVNATNKTNENRYLKNTNRLILKKEDSIHSRYYEYCVGGKTGYTDEAGRTLVTYGKKDGKNIIVTIFGASPNGSVDVRYTDAITLFDYAFDNFTKHTIALDGNYNFNYINIDKNLKYSISPTDDLEILVKNNQEPTISYTLDINNNLLDTIEDNSYSNSKAGTITFNIKTEENSYSLVKDLYLKDVQEYKTFSIKYIIITAVFILVGLILVALIISVVHINKQKKHNHKYSRKNRRI